jgi:ubiquinone/menaquinone biosynthesis C-methylase UbiE/DNA-binding transcriptional ArsR family regulator
MEQLVIALKALSDPTRLRLLQLVARSELAVTDLTWIVRQSQPRVSRHLKILTEAGLLERHKEGSWVYYRLAASGSLAVLLPALVEAIDKTAIDVVRDIERLEEIQNNRSEAAQRYFAMHATEWDSLRALYVPETEVEHTILSKLTTKPVRNLLDVGTGTGRILEVMAPHIQRGVGIDNSREMLALARARLDKKDLQHCQVRLGDMYDLPADNDGYDAVTFHQVLHFSDDPQSAIREAAKVLSQDGSILIVDFTPHQHEDLREKAAHTRLGFSDNQIQDYFRAAGLKHLSTNYLEGGELKVAIWHGTTTSTKEKTL